VDGPGQRQFLVAAAASGAAQRHRRLAAGDEADAPTAGHVGGQTRRRQPSVGVQSPQQLLLGTDPNIDSSSSSSSSSSRRSISSSGKYQRVLGSAVAGLGGHETADQVGQTGENGADVGRFAAHSAAQDAAVEAELFGAPTGRFQRRPDVADDVVADTLVVATARRRRRRTPRL